MESSATIGEGRYGVRGDIQWGGAVFGPSLSSYRLSISRGITPQLDVSVAPSAIVIRAPEPGNPHGGIYALRVGVKYAPTRYTALSYGLTPGGSAGGSFLAHDAGVTVGGENPYLVPFAGFHGLLSVPLKARTVRIVHTDEDEQDRPTADPAANIYFRRPGFTAGWQAVAGLKVPLWRDAQTSDDNFARRVRPSLVCVVGLTSLYSHHDNAGFGTFGCAMDATF